MTSEEMVGPMIVEPDFGPKDIIATGTTLEEGLESSLFRFPSKSMSIATGSPYLNITKITPGAPMMIAWTNTTTSRIARNTLQDSKIVPKAGGISPVFFYKT